MFRCDRRAGLVRQMSRMGFAAAALIGCDSGTEETIIAPVPQNPAAQWEAIVPSNGLPAEAAGRLAIPNTADFTLTGLDPESGRVLWLRALPVGTVGVAGFGDVFVATRIGAPDSTAATFIDPISGVDLWGIRLSAQQPRPVLRVGRTIVASINDTILVGLDRTSGNEAWRAPLAPQSCAGTTFCNRLSPIGVDRGDGYILRQSSTQAQIITVRETGVTGQVVAQSAALRAVNDTSRLAAVAGAGLVVGVSGGTVAGVDPGTGAQRWQTAISALVPSSFRPTPVNTRFTTDGTFLLAQMSDSVAARELVIGTVNGQLVRQRPITSEQLTQPNLRCGADGYAYLRDTGFEHVDLRTGVVAPVARIGLRNTLLVAGLSNAFATTGGYIVFSQEFAHAPDAMSA
ncbi:MAG: PQQ-binding-like beta-propeller repeat protein [Gemmatimonadaceae bacterium]|nr:PQQ-binding-like beta-propeller repeat protein [Gemmatimonadaceae bacterium]